MSKPRVSIIIPVHDNWHFTKRCLETVSEHTPHIPIEIIVVDNGSTDDTTTALSRDFPHVRAFHFPGRLSFSRACNAGAKEAAADLLLFLNNDTEVTAGWLDPLMEELLASEEIAAVGPKLLYPDGTVQHAGVVFALSGIAYHFGMHWDGAHPEVNKRREFKALTAACLLCRKKHFLDAGGFDEQYKNGCEDTDLCLQWLQKGYRMVYVPRSAVIHHESKTPGRFDSSTQNLAVYANKWKNHALQDDMDYYFKSRLPQKGVASIGVAVWCEGSLYDLYGFLFYLLSTSQCALSVLVITPGHNKKNIDEYNRYAPLVSIVSDNECVLDSWIESCRAMTGFSGILFCKSMFMLMAAWDRALVEFPDRSRPLAPILSDSVNAQGWLRFMANLPEAVRRDTLQSLRTVRGSFNDMIICARSVSGECLFFPAPALFHNVGNAVRDMSPTSPFSRIFSAVLPVFTIDTNRKIEHALNQVTLASVILVDTAASFATCEKIIVSLQKNLPPDRTELIIVDTRDYRPDPALHALLETSLNACTINPKIPLPVNAARNLAASVSISPFLVFIQPDAYLPAGNWLRSLLMPLTKPDECAVTYLPPQSCGCLPGSLPAATGDTAAFGIFAVRRCDFWEIQGFETPLDEIKGPARLIERLCSRTKLPALPVDI